MATKGSKKAADFDRLYEALANRCQEAGIPIERRETVFELDGRRHTSRGASLALSAGRSKRSLYVGEAKGIEDFLSIDFEEYTLLGDYAAIASYSSATIEAAITSLRPGQLLALQQLLGQELAQREQNDEGAQPLLLKGPDGGIVNTRIGPMSRELALLGGLPPFRARSYPSLRIEGLPVSQHDQALAILEKLSDSLFFQIDLTRNLPLTLAKARRIRQGRGRTGKLAETALVFPEYEYDEQPMSLYWYARSARELPLLQFLAFYQTIEFYFPIYSQFDVQRRIRNILKDPSFSPGRDPDVGRLVATMRGAVGRGYGDERSQLRATLLECLSAEGVREFIKADEIRAQALTTKSKILGLQALQLDRDSADIRSDVAARLYEIRCKIVHTKSSSGDDEVDLLLPFSKEAEALEHDIGLIQYVAQQVLISASRPIALRAVPRLARPDA